MAARRFFTIAIRCSFGGRTARLPCAWARASERPPFAGWKVGPGRSVGSASISGASSSGSRRSASDRERNRVRTRRVVPGRKADPLRDPKSGGEIPTDRHRVAVRKSDRDWGFPRRPPQTSTTAAALSPDGASFAGIGRGGDIWIVPLAGGEARRIDRIATSPGGRVFPVGWTSDSRHLFVHRVGSVPGQGSEARSLHGKVEPGEDLTLEDLAGIVRIHSVRVAPDGNSWAYSYIRVLSNLYVVEGLK